MMRWRAVWLGLAGAGVVVGVVALAAWGAVAYTSRPAFCASCHVMQTRYVSWQRSPHGRAATCIQCHAEPGLVGEIKAHLNGTRYLWVLLTGDKSGTILRAAVSSATCAQCHPASRLPQDTATLRVDHARHVARGIPCAGCHAGLVHGTLYGHQARPAVERCDRCHAAERRPFIAIDSRTPGGRPAVPSAPVDDRAP
jgi:nitrate/TMAO reductase-like tetraheme cytochrome c subunit